MRKNTKNYPLNHVTPISSIKEMMELAVKDAGEKVAFRYKEGEDIVDVTYEKFFNETLYLGTALVELGVSDKHIAMVGINCYKWVCTYVSVLKSNGVYVPIDKELPLSDMINIIVDSDSEVLFCSEKYEKELASSLDKMPKVKFIIGLDRDTDSEDDKILSYDRLIEKGKALYESGDRRYADITSDPTAMKLLVYTSGTTGNAKGVMLSEHNLVSCVYYGLQVSTVYSTSLSVLPYHHTYEAVAGLLVSLHHHSTICINDNLKNVLKNLNIYHPDYIYIVPAFAEVFYRKIWSNAKNTGKEKMLKTMIPISNVLRKVGIDLRKKLFSSIHNAFGGNLKKIVCGGAPIRAEIGEFFDAIGIDLINGYGITECSPLVSANRDLFNDCATVGIPLPCCEIRIDTPDEDGNGEICVKGDIVMLGYYKQPEMTKEVLEQSGWFHTGDYGNLNEKGQLLITARKKNLIVLANGKNIFPEEIEGYIQAIPYVGEVVVYGHKDEHGQEVALYAEVYMPKDKLAEFGITNALSQLKKDATRALAELPEYKKIAKFIERDCEFEKTTTNKIRRNKIVKQ